MTDVNREYQRLKVEVHAVTLRLQNVLNAHAAEQAKHAEYWSYVGDLKHARVELLQLCAFLGDREAREILHAEGVAS